ncbi:cell division protein FtsZ [Comamonas antarctica]|uniref:Cell division protein FtsZ n=1 Tax=Comamonas antarctica TaxID=2743470 RepID=A0A6N1X4B1_9BURK|nr:cell division protein FtsZ [Comamonas antarctica]QKV53123.1 cell division protein FtsZ [Comamonas antarctica]
MSTLQISLAILGVVVLALIVAYNSWAARRNAPKRAQPEEDEAGLPGHHQPYNLTERHEPALDLTHGGHAPEPVGPQTVPLAQAQVHEQYLSAPAQRREPALGEEAPADGAPVATAVPAAAAASAAATPAAVPAEPAFAAEAAHIPPERRPSLDALIDAIAPIQPEHVIPGEGALQVQPTTRRAGSKPFRIEGLNQKTRQWEPLQAGSRYTAFQAGVQLANRMGALNEIEFSEFASKAQAFADAVSGSVDLPDMLQEVARARELDQFASEHDAQLTFMLRARQAAWSPGYVVQNAARLGFVPLSMPGRMALPSAAGGQPLLVLAYDAQAAMAEDIDQSAILEILLSLDVPQVHRSEQPFARLREVADGLCQSMEGVLCDQNGHPLPVSVVEPIAADLEHLYDQLDSRELSAGSMLARRLFS